METDYDRLVLQQPAGCIRQSSGFSFPSQYNCYTSVETKAKTSEPALMQRQTHICQNTLVKQMESHAKCLSLGMSTDRFMQVAGPAFFIF